MANCSGVILDKTQMVSPYEIGDFPIFVQILNECSFIDVQQGTKQWYPCLDLFYCIAFNS